VLLSDPKKPRCGSIPLCSAIFEGIPTKLVVYFK
jgi:hypothetical protein